MRYEPVIGLEIHAELRTKTKMFCFSKNDPDEKHPNVNVCPICMGHPGTLPVINEEAVKMVLTVGAALHGNLAVYSQFDRKNYFYPDLPKGYQISQYKYPLVSGGYVDIEISDQDEEEKLKNKNVKIKMTARNSEVARKIRIQRIHLEEDTGRLVHDQQSGSSLVDFNRAGVPLMELVTESDFRSGAEVKKFGEELQTILRYLEVSDANMEKGEMRVEVNISLRPLGSKTLGTKVEVKNINSFKFAADAVEYEIKRQTEALENGEKIVQETRGWNEDKKSTFPQRSKEEAHDYRYFPEPDLPPLRFSAEYLEMIAVTVPELPAAKRRRFIEEYGISAEAARILARDKRIAGYFEEAISELRRHEKDTPEAPKKALAPLAASIFIGEFLRLIDGGAGIAETRVTPENFGELVALLAEEKISNLAAKEVLAEMVSSGADPSDVVEHLGLWQTSESADLEDIVTHIFSENPKAVEDYTKGKEASLQFLIGQVMKESRGKANPKVVGDIIVRRLSGTS